MKISGFTFVRNATKLYYPIKASILSILPICDEFIVALGAGDEGDETEKEIQSIGSNKIKIIHTKWDALKFHNGSVYAQQTDVAKSHCKGDWLFYIQSDEVVHEKYLETIKKQCQKYMADKAVEGFLFGFLHFWGDYKHHIISHAWYPREIRIIRNKSYIHSWRDAQSFRRIDDFDGLNYFQRDKTEKLNVVKLDAYVYHYGWVRPPEYMQKKRKAFSTFYRGEKSAEQQFEKEEELFNYNNLDKLKEFTGSHPAVLSEWINKFNWADSLYPAKKTSSKKHKHEKIKYRILTFLEQTFFRGNLIGGFKNYKILKRD